MDKEHDEKLNEKSRKDERKKFWQSNSIAIIVVIAVVAISAFSLGSMFSGHNAGSSGQPSSAGNAASSSGNGAQTQTKTLDFNSLAGEVFPKDGIVLNVTWGDSIAKTVRSGAIDIDKFKQVYEQAGQPLTQEEINILNGKVDKPIVINSSNAYFLVNALWALGLTNKNDMLSKGPISQFDQVSRLASTGGWRLGNNTNAMVYFNNYSIIKLTPAQEKIVNDVVMNTYRPCCNNPAGFPDCNHGMAALALAELMASQGASKSQIYSALKAANSYWFPQQYMELAAYFNATKNESWSQADAKTVLSADYSSASGWSNIDRQLQSKGLVPQAKSGSASSC